MDRSARPPTIELQHGDALLVVDLQRDFLPGGALAVPHGDAVVAPVQHAVQRFAAHGLPVWATRDWHPVGHCSFRAAGGPWPPHCVAGTAGAEFAPGLRLPPGAGIVSKGSAVERDAYSGFSGTDLDARLRAAGVRRLVVAGLATDYCVLETVRDARRLGWPVTVLGDAIAAVDVHAGDGERAVAQMRAAGADLAATGDLR